MEALVSAVVGDLISRTISFAVDRCCHRRRKAGGTEDGPQRLRRVLLRVQLVVEEADRRHVTNQAMLRQLQLMREGVYRGYYLLSALSHRRRRRRRRHQEQGVITQDGAAQDGEVSRHDRSFALSQFNPAKRLCTSTISSVMKKTTTSTAASDGARHEGGAEAELEEVLNGLERMASDMKELVVLLSCYPPTRREPYSAHLWLERRMFGREAELERIIGFLLEPEPAHAEDPAVLPVIGRARVGKSTLVEHVCFDDRVRSHFSMIVFFGEGDVVNKHGGEHNGGITKHRDDRGSAGKSLVVIELAGEVDELHAWWRRTLSTRRGQLISPSPVSKIIVTSRSEKIASLGTTQALELKPLPREAYWYFFKTMAFGSTDAEDQPELGSACMEIADLLNRSFIAANLFGVLLRANPCPRFWHKVLEGFKHYTSMHVLLFGEHPSDLLANDRPVCLWRLPAETSGVLVAYSCYQSCSGQHHDMPKITLNDVHIGSATPPRGKFQLLAWRSHIPPCYSYFMNCGVQTSSTLFRIPSGNKQNRHRQALLNSM
ncbi:hypothetical protein BS78_03G259400 [Paspalum vaginatum]|nr:hypothetical protein BS78_03G259400 [Paspalum vaginatum]